MYHAIVRRQAGKPFNGLSQGNWETALASMAKRFEHIAAPGKAQAQLAVGAWNGW